MDGTVEPTALSAEWRINSSRIKELELLEILRSLKRLASHHTDKIGTLRYMTEIDVRDSDIPAPAYATTNDPDKPVDIVISPVIAKAGNTYPLPPEQFDVMCGLTLHEVAHIIVGSFDVSNEIRCNGFLRINVIPLINIIGEEICAESYFPDKGLVKQKKYLKIAREKVDTGGNFDCNTGNPLGDAVKAAGLITIVKHPVTSISDKGREILLIILDGFKDLTKKSPHERCNVYHDVSGKIREILDMEADKERVADPRGKRLRADHTKENFKRGLRDAMERGAKETVANTNTPLDSGGYDKDDPTGSVLSNEESSELAKLAADETSDVSSLVHQLVNEARKERAEEEKLSPAFSSKPLRTIISRVETGSGGKYWDTEQRLVSELLWLRNIKTTRDTILLKAQVNGKIDKRRLYRAPIDGKIFKDTRKAKVKRNIWLLMDNSGSMSHKDDLFRMCASVHKVIPEARIYTYEENNDGDTKISRVDDRDGMKHIQTGSTTPSGDAIIFTANLLQKHGGGVIIHFTDGVANAGYSVQDAYEVVERKAPKVGLITASSSRHALDRNYSKQTRQIKSVLIENPTAFSKLLRNTIADMWGLV